jgi:hypothetical protein
LDQFFLNASGRPPLSASGGGTWDAGNLQIGSGIIGPALVDYGMFLGSTSSDAQSSEYLRYMNIVTSVRATSDDVFTITPTNTNLVGTTASMTFGLQALGTVSADVELPSGTADPFDNANAGWTMTATISSFEGSVHSTSGYRGDPLGAYAITVDVVLGSPTELTLEYSVGTNSRADVGGIINPPSATPAHAVAVAAFANTMGWLGITQVLDAQGNAVQFTLLSESGTDWTKSQIAAVPEPSLWATLATGMGLLVLLGYRRSR